jgi:hypothetical protein
MKQKLLISIILFLTVNAAFAQVFTNKEVGQRNQSKKDSLKTAEYPYTLPIWGAKATNAGYSLPYSAGLSVQYFWQESDLIIENLQVGFNGGELYNLDNVVRFDKVKATASAITVRPDVWVFPFLNVYAILGRSQASTEVGFGVYVPDETNNFNPILNANTIVEFQASTFGLGLTPTIGVGGGFLALDLNMSWTDVPQLRQPARTFVFGPRFGKNFRLKNPESSIAVWVGGFRVDLNSETNGSIAINEILPVDEFQVKVDNGIEKVGEAQVKVDTWWEGLSPADQRNPVNIAKHNAANNAITTASQILVAADAALNDGESATVQYAMDKRPADMWNFIVGSQYQLNKHLMFRLEGGFLGSRTQLMGGVQYRFGL